MTLNDCYRFIPLNLTNLDLAEIKGPFVESFEGNFNNYSIKNPAYLASLIEHQIQFDIEPDLVVYSEILDQGTWPHIDNCYTVLNYYIHSTDARTWFFEHNPNIEARTETATNPYSQSSRYDVEQLHSIGYFESQNNSAYLLNTKIIHGVEKRDLASVRTMIRWIWRTVPFRILQHRIRLLN